MLVTQLTLSRPVPVILLSCFPSVHLSSWCTKLLRRHSQPHHSLQWCLNFKLIWISEERAHNRSTLRMCGICSFSLSKFRPGKPMCRESNSSIPKQLMLWRQYPGSRSFTLLKVCKCFHKKESINSRGKLYSCEDMLIWSKEGGQDTGWKSFKPYYNFPGILWRALSPRFSLTPQGH